MQRFNRHRSLQVFTNGEQFYEEELAAISAAKRSINLEAYIFHEGKIGNRFVDQLAKQARNGVKANLVLDAIGNARTRKSFFAKLEAAGGRVSWYNGSRWNKLPRFNNQTHRELLVIDGHVGFVGVRELRTSGGRERRVNRPGATQWFELKGMP